MLQQRTYRINSSLLRLQLLTLFFISISYTQERGKDMGLQYLISYPKDYQSDSKEKWPLILFLHGIGERGNDIELIKIHGIPKITQSDKNFPFITVSPQCPIEFDWRDHSIQDKVINLLEKVLSNHHVDLDRVYITGLSMGGYGTWSIAAKRPDLFAAAIPICGGGDPTLAKHLKNLPIWVFHGLKDTVVLPEESVRMVNAIKKLDGNIKLTLYPDAGHDSWTQTYSNKEIYDWLLTNKQKNNL